MSAIFLTHKALTTRHGFFTCQGGVSRGNYASLNANFGGGDDRDHVRANRALIAAALGVAPARLLGLKQVHGTRVITVTAPWPEGAGDAADALVTREPGLALGVITADCAPVLFHNTEAGVIGAAHAGWRGAVAGILEATLAAMARLGADPARVAAVIGPCIAQPSYEVAADLRDAVLAGAAADARFFAGAARPGHWRFDLPGYCAARLRAAGTATVESLDADTCADAVRFFSHRRRTLTDGGPIGHQMSAIVL